MPVEGTSTTAVARRQPAEAQGIMPTLTPHLVKVAKWVTVTFVVFRYLWGYSMLLAIVALWRATHYLRWAEWRWFGGRGQYLTLRLPQNSDRIQFLRQYNRFWHKAFDLKYHGEFWRHTLALHQEFWWRLLTGRQITMRLLWNMYCPIQEWRIAEDRIQDAERESGFWKRLFQLRYHYEYWQRTAEHHGDFWRRLRSREPISGTLVWNMFCPVQDWRLQEAKDFGGRGQCNPHSSSRGRERSASWQRMFDLSYHNHFWRRTCQYHYQFWWRLMHGRPVTAALLWNMYCPVEDWRQEEDEAAYPPCSGLHDDEGCRRCVRHHACRWSRHCNGHCDVLIQYNKRFTMYKKMPLKAMSRLWGSFNQLVLPPWIRSPAFQLYIWMYQCALHEADVQDLRHYRNLSEFFRRRLKPGTRPVNRAYSLVSPVDGTVLHLGRVQNGCLEQVKGVTYSLRGFIGPLQGLITRETITRAATTAAEARADPPETPAVWYPSVTSPIGLHAAAEWFTFDGGDHVMSSPSEEYDSEGLCLGSSRATSLGGGACSPRGDATAGASPSPPSSPSLSPKRVAERDAHAVSPTAGRGSTGDVTPAAAGGGDGAPTAAESHGCVPYGPGPWRPQRDRLEADFGRQLLVHRDTALFHCVLYLGPGDYHRFHSPADWRVRARRHFPGELFSVNPGIARWLQGLFNLNERALYVGRWRHGFFSMTAVGATNVGSINVYFDKDLKTNTTHAGRQEHAAFTDKDFSGRRRRGVPLSRGQMMGEFNFGSTIVLLFEAPANFQFTAKPGQRVKVGQGLGHYHKSSSVKKSPS